MEDLEKGKNFANKPKKVLEWSKQHFPDILTRAINSGDLQNIQESSR